MVKNHALWRTTASLDFATLDKAGERTLERFSPGAKMVQLRLDAAIKSDMTTRVLFIGQGLFCEGLIRLLSESPAVEIIGAVSTCSQALERISQEAADVLIVDHAQITMNSAELTSLLESAGSLKVISLTLLENKMIVNDRQLLADVTLPMLMQALQVASPNPAASEG